MLSILVSLLCSYSPQILVTKYGIRFDCIFIPALFDPATREGAFLALVCDESIFDDFTVASSDVPWHASEAMFIEDGRPMQTSKRQPVISVPKETPAIPRMHAAISKAVSHKPFNFFSFLTFCMPQAAAGDAPQAKTKSKATVKFHSLPWPLYFRG